MSRLVLIALLVACHKDPPEKAPPKAEKPPVLADPFADERHRMVEDTIVARGVTDKEVVEAMRLVPRHEFVPPEVRDEAYADRPLPIGFGLTISQPYIVAFMTAAAGVHSGDKVLEIGTGSGYQAAVLAAMGAKVYTIEIHEELSKRTRAVLDHVGFDEVQLRTGDGWFGWKEAAPFDAILVTTAPPSVPTPLLEQLKDGGKMVVPVGELEQQLVVITKSAGQTTRQSVMEVRFGPMLGEAQKHAVDLSDPY